MTGVQTCALPIYNAGLGGVRDIFISDIDDTIIDQIKHLRQQLKSYKEIKKILNISEDKLIKICRLNNINKPSNTFRKKELNIGEVVEYYNKVNSLRVTSKHFNTSRDTIRQYISDDLIEKNKCNRKEIKISPSKAVVNWRRRKKIELVEYKGGKCERCGYNKTIQALQFHHLDPKEKDFAIEIGRAHV